VYNTNEQEFFARWEERRDWLSQMGGAANAATLIDAMLTEVRTLLKSKDDEVLSLSQASIESGYSTDHLGRLIRNGTIPNAGRRGSPRLRRSDLPVRPGSQNGGVALARPMLHGAPSREQVARAVVERHGGAR